MVAFLTCAELVIVTVLNSANYGQLSNLLCIGLKPNSLLFCYKSTQLCLGERNVAMEPFPR